MLVATTIAATALATPALGAPHTVQPGESLSSVAAANGISTETLAADNGLAADSALLAGQTIDVPSTVATATATDASSTPTASAPASTASGSGVEHTVQPGESLSSVAAANGVSTETLAADNGLAADTALLAGQTIDVPSTGAVASAAPASGTTTSASSPSPAPPSPPPPAAHPYWTSSIPCPSCPGGVDYLASNAASSWNAMRQESLRLFGIDLYPGGPYSAYRSYGQQLYLYDLYRSGEGNLAAVPGTSSHEYGTAVDLADPAMRTVIDQIGARYGWAKTEASSEWWHVDYVGP